MIDALEKISRRSVAASVAKHSHSYICPECRQAVILRSGNVRSAYFAHAPGVSDEDCALYAAALSNAHGYASTKGYHEADAEMRLSLKLASSNGIYAWGLELVVPTLGLPLGSLFIEVGGRTTELRLDGSPPMVRTITAEPQSNDYKIIETQPDWGNSGNLQLTCPGLKSCGGTVFGDILRLNGNAIQLADSLRCDRTYAILWNDGNAPTFPEEVIVESMTARQGWNGALIQFPPSLSEDSRNWLTEFTKLAFAESLPSIIPVWPPLLRTVTSRCIEARASQVITFFVEPDIHSNTAVPPPIFARSQKEERIAQTDIASRPFYQLSPHESKNVHLACRTTDGLELDIDFVLQDAPIRERLLNSVVLHGTDKAGQGRIAKLHSKDARIWLSGVRNGEIHISSIKVPFGVRGKIKADRQNGWSTVLQLSGEQLGKAQLLSRDTILRISEILHDSRLNVLVDFGGFGQARIEASIRSNTDSNVRFPEPLLARIRHYLIRFPDPQVLNIVRRSSVELDLVEALLRSRPTHSSLIAHRTMVADIKKIQAQLSNDTRGV